MYSKQVNKIANKLFSHVIFLSDKCFSLDSCFNFKKCRDKWILRDIIYSINMSIFINKKYSHWNRFVRQTINSGMLNSNGYLVLCSTKLWFNFPRKNTDRHMAENLIYPLGLSSEDMLKKNSTYLELWLYYNQETGQTWMLSVFSKYIQIPFAIPCNEL